MRDSVEVVSLVGTETTGDGNYQLTHTERRDDMPHAVLIRPAAYSKIFYAGEHMPPAVASPLSSVGRAHPW